MSRKDYLKKAYGYDGQISYEKKKKKKKKKKRGEKYDYLTQDDPYSSFHNENVTVKQPPPTTTNSANQEGKGSVSLVQKQVWKTVEEIKTVDDNLSPPPEKEGDLENSDGDEDLSPPRRRARHDSPGSDEEEEEDLSPPRRRKRHDSSDSDEDEDEDDDEENDGDQSPPRRRRRRHDSSEEEEEELAEIEPPPPSIIQKEDELEEEEEEDVNISGKKRKRREQRPIISFVPPLKKEGEEGLQLQPDRKKRKLLDGEDAEVVYRDERGRKLSKEEYSRLQEEKKKKRVEQEEMFWAGGMIQFLEQKRQAEGGLGLGDETGRTEGGQNSRKKTSRGIFIGEEEEISSEKDMMLKSRVHEEDPMRDFVMEKRKKKEEKKMKKTMKKGGHVRPIYRGPAPVNRFGIRPGHRWDGVVRGNDFENKVMEKI